jgi:hypothetical protein
MVEAQLKVDKRGFFLDEVDNMVDLKFELHNRFKIPLCSTA